MDQYYIDSLSIRKPTPTTIGGILGDSNGLFVCIFSCFIGIEDSNAVEFLAFKNALSILAPRFDIQSSKRGLIFEFDSMIAVSWVLNQNTHPWRLSFVYNSMNNNLRVFPSIRIQHVPKEANWTIETLAKQGLHILRFHVLLSPIPFCFFLVLLFVNLFHFNCYSVQSLYSQDSFVTLFFQVFMSHNRIRCYKIRL